MEDNYRHKGLRSKMVADLRAKGISSPLLLSAFMKVPRHLFLDSAFAKWAYKDNAFPIEAEQTISRPFTVARQTELLEVKSTDKILEIGTGSGYQASILYELGAKVYSIERQKTLFDRTSRFLNHLGYGGIRTLYGDGYLGAPRFAPYDKIIVTCGATDCPPTLLEQLKIGGIMVIPIGNNEQQKLIKIVKISAEKYTSDIFDTCSFVPFLNGVNENRVI